MSRVLPVFLALLPAPAIAHGFGDAPSWQAAFAEGQSVMLGWPAVTVSLIAGGILAGLAFATVKHLWLAFVVGQIVALGFTLTVQPWHFFAPFAAGILAAAIALSGLYRRRGTALLAVGAVGFGAQLAALDGHPLGELPWIIHMGYGAVASFVVAVVSLPIALALRVWPDAKLHILGQILSSWCLAILVLMLAVVVNATT